MRTPIPADAVFVPWNRQLLPQLLSYCPLCFHNCLSDVKDYNWELQNSEFSVDFSKFFIQTERHIRRLPNVAAHDAKESRC